MITLKENQLDLGEIKLQTEKIFDVTVINPESIDQVVLAKPTCSSCTFLQSGPVTIPANGEGYYKFLFRPDSKGEMARSINFMTGDIIGVTLRFKATVI